MKERVKVGIIGFGRMGGFYADDTSLDILTLILSLFTEL